MADKHSSRPALVRANFSPDLSWPILLAGIPTLGAFFAGSSEIWSDFIMVLLILLYVYKWMTVPWAYYESARSRRLIHQQSSVTTELKAGPKVDDSAYLHRMKIELEKQQSVHAELRRHELAGLIWIVLSPLIAGYTLQYSRYLLSNFDRYISAFNTTVFVMAASIKPLSQVLLLLQERTLYLQNEASFDETEASVLQNRLNSLERELDTLRRAYATKKDLGQIADDINPTIQHLVKAMHRFEKRDSALRHWSQEQFIAIEQKVKEFDQYVCYRIEQDQRQQAHGIVISLILLPLNISLWVAKCMSLWLPAPHKGLLEKPNTASKQLSAQTFSPSQSDLDYPLESL